jgi:ferritin-like metal-binding protein YciE
VLLQGAVEVEHHEIGVYENLIDNAHAMGREDVVELLHRNLASEEATLGKARHASSRVAAITPQDPPQGAGGVAGKVRSALGH